VTAPITLEEAMARAIKYNLDYRLGAMEQALQNRQLDVTRYDMLPKLVAGAGGTVRSNENLSVSRNTATGLSSSDPSLSQDQKRATADLAMSWNVLDFGVSYYQARQQADRVLIAQERRRRVIHSIIQQVRSAYWQAATAEKLQAEIGPVLADARRVLADYSKVERERLCPPIDVLREQKGLVEIVRQLEAVEQDLGIARAQLAALMNLPPGRPFALALSAGFQRETPAVELAVEDMERMALLNRPELREEQYQKRISAAEVHKAMLRMLPGLTFSTSVSYDSNSYLINNSWAEAGLRVSWNLLSLLSGPAAIRAAEAQEDLGETRRLALSMASLTQVHVGWQQYQRSKAAFEQAELLNSIEQRIFETISRGEAGQARSPVERIRAATSAISAELVRDRSYADLQNAFSTLYVSLGLDPLPETVTGHDVKTLAAAIADVSADWQAGRIPVPPPLESLAEPPAPVPVAVTAESAAREPARVEVELVSPAERLSFLKSFVVPPRRPVQTAAR
jgi:multidrug efflux system outer membrane protein